MFEPSETPPPCVETLGVSADMLYWVAVTPVPFDTYHTARDASETLDARALDAVVQALEALISETAR